MFEKNLIYFTLGNNPDYINIAKLCVDSLYKNQYDGDLLFITDLSDELVKNIKFKKTPFFMDTENTNLLSSSSNKLKIHMFPNVSKFDKIIYCDLDILWLGDPKTLFDLITEDKIYMSNENSLMSEKYWGGDILDEDEKKDIESNNTKGLNAGFFGFNKKMVVYFEEIENFLDQNLELVNVCLEQPFINVFLHRNKMYNTEFNQYISHNGYNIDSFDGVVLHFAGGPGNFEMKYNKMINYIEQND